VGLDRYGITGQLLDFGVIDGEGAAFRNGYADFLHRLAGLCRIAVHHLHHFRPEPPPQDRFPAVLQPPLVDVELVGIDLPLHDGFAKPVGGGNEDDLVEPRLRVERENHAACGEIASHHALHAHGQRHGFVRITLVHAIRDGAVVVQRGVNLLDGGQAGGRARAR
jgi:hypothetical protein